MSAHEERQAVGRDGRFVRAAGLVGDLGNPFYREERQRDVWNEASAVGLQLVLWLGLGAAGAMVWLGGAGALPYAVAVVSVLGVGSAVSLLYAQQLGVRVEDAGQVLRLRLVPYTALLTFFLLGAARAAPSGGFGASFARGMALGGAGAVLWLVWGDHRRRREQRGRA